MQQCLALARPAFEVAAQARRLELRHVAPHGDPGQEDGLVDY